jgi:glycosyltransferase involved in cell wall biosynthesis
LEWYATSIFHQPDRWPYRLERYAPEPLAARLRAEFGRFSHPGLDPTLVRTGGLAEWFERLASRAGWRQLAQRIDAFGNRRFVAQIAADIASDQDFALWGYNGSSLTSFERAKQHGRHCILDRTIGDHRVFNAMMDDIADRYGDWFLPTERRIAGRLIKADRREYELADRIVVGSPFAARTIAEAGEDPAITGKVRVLRYCYDEQLFGSLPAPVPFTPDRPVRFLFMGLVIPRKGIHHVLEAIAQLPANAAELTIVGDLKIPSTVFAPYADRVTYRRTVPRSQVPAIMSSHDVLLLPSYFEGAGIVLYEALAAGCALIQSNRCADAVTPETGLLLPELSTSALLEAMTIAVEDRERLNSWRAAAQQAARDYTFARYRENIAALLSESSLT